MDWITAAVWIAGICGVVTIVLGIIERSKNTSDEDDLRRELEAKEEVFEAKEAMLKREIEASKEIRAVYAKACEYSDSQLYKIYELLASIIKSPDELAAYKAIVDQLKVKK